MNGRKTHYLVKGVRSGAGISRLIRTCNDVHGRHRQDNGVTGQWVTVRGIRIAMLGQSSAKLRLGRGSRK